MTALAANKQARLAGAAGDVRPARGDARTRPTRCRRVSRRGWTRGPSTPSALEELVGADRAAGLRAGRARRHVARGDAGVGVGRGVVLDPALAARLAGPARAGRSSRPRPATTPASSPPPASPPRCSSSATRRGCPTRPRSRRPWRTASPGSRPWPTSSPSWPVTPRDGVPARTRLGRRRRTRRGVRRDRGRAVHRGRASWAFRSASRGLQPHRTSGIPGRPGIPHRLPGLTIPGLANCHSHAFHRALRGRTQRERGTFWTWREQMYAVAERLDPDSYLALATGDVPGDGGERDHQRGGVPLPAPPARRDAVRRPQRHGPRARRRRPRRPGCGSRLLDTCYLTSGFGEPPEGVQRRFSDGTRRRVGRAASQRPRDAGAAIHSVRAVPDDQLRTVVEASTGKPLHVHLSEQTEENDACVAAYGATPTQLLADHGVLGPLTSAVHATHLTDDDVAPPRHARAPTPASAPPPSATSATASAPAGPSTTPGSPLTLGSDSHAVVDLFEEMRAVELDERLATRSAGTGRPPSCSRPRRADGHASLGYDDAGAIAVGNRADLVTLDTTTPAHRRHRPRRAHRRLRGHRGRRRPGRRRRQGRLQPGRRGGDRPRARRRDRQALAMTIHRHHQHRRAGHQRPAGRRRRPARHRHRRGASSSTATTVAWVGPPREAPAADTYVDAGGRAVIPGFVDCHSHLVFAGRPRAGVRRPDGRDAVRRRRHPHHRRRHPRRHRRAAHRTRRRAGRRDAPPGHHDRRDQERLRPDRPRRGPQPGDRAAVHRGDDLPRRARRPRGQRRPRSTSPWSPARCSRPAPRTRAGSTCSASGAPSTTTRPARSSRPGAAKGLRGRLHANQLGPGPGVRLAAELGLVAVDHCTYLDDADVAALADSGTVATLLPGVEFSTRQPYPDARRLLDAGVTVAIASDCNPGSSYTSSMPLCVALAVREMRMTPAEATYAATAGGAAALDRDDVGRLVPGRPGRPGAAGRPQPRAPGLPAGGAAGGRHLGRRTPLRWVNAQVSGPEVGPRRTPWAEIRHLPDVRAYLRGGVSTHTRKHPGTRKGNRP